MHTAGFARALGTIFEELVNGSSESGGYVLNARDEGLLRSLDKLSSEQASALTPTGSSVAAHVDHVRYGLSLMNRWAHGEKPFGDADWSSSWRRTVVTEDEWQRLRMAIRSEAGNWIEELRTEREVDEIELNGMIGSVAHMAYHLGAIRQIDRMARGPVEANLASRP